MRSFEWIACAYFGYLIVASWRPPLPARRRAFLIAASAIAGGAVWVVAHAGTPLVRDWAPLAYILAGYVLSGCLFVVPSDAIESWLMGWDRRLMGDSAARFVSWPRPLLAGFELIYMGCFLMVPAGLAILVANGRGSLADRYWTMVLGAEFASFARWRSSDPSAMGDRAEAGADDPAIRGSRRGWCRT